MKIAVAGTGYVGLSIATLLAQHNEVVAVDVIPEKVEKINNRISPIQDEYIEKYLAEKELNLRATLDGREAYKDADFIVIAAPTNYDPQKNFFDTHHIEDVIDLILEVNPEATMVIKSTIPVGYCRSLYVKYAKKKSGHRTALLHVPAGKTDAVPGAMAVILRSQRDKFGNKRPCGQEEQDRKTESQSPY